MRKPRCTCLPLNSRLMAHLLKVDQGSVHEQDCVERAVAEAVAQERARIRAAVEAMPDCSPLAESPETIIEYGEGYCDGLFAGRSQVLRVLDPEAEGGTE